MKRLVIIATLMACLTMAADAHHKCKEDWKEKMMSEKIAFLTMEMDITPEEAQVFWPVYNQMEKKKDAALEQVIRSYKELNAAIEANNKNEIDKCLTAYLQAQETLREIESDTAEQYKAVLPVEKVAKLYVGEEKFRRQHIRKLHGGHANK
jgi:Spy/CpxP family protein refolding chaperone